MDEHHLLGAMQSAGCQWHVSSHHPKTRLDQYARSGHSKPAGFGGGDNVGGIKASTMRSSRCGEEPQSEVRVVPWTRGRTLSSVFVWINNEGEALVVPVVATGKKLAYPSWAEYIVWSVLALALDSAAGPRGPLGHARRVQFSRHFGGHGGLQRAPSGCLVGIQQGTWAWTCQCSWYAFRTTS